MSATRIAAAFGSGRWLQGYIRGKLLADPVFDTGLAEVMKQGRGVIDLGCGLGLFGLWLKAHGFALPYLGCDLGAWKIEAGRKTALRLGYGEITLHARDLTEFPLGRLDTICAFDVLHYLPKAEQERVIRRLAQAARGGALVLIRTGVRGCGWRSAFTLLEEWWTRASGWIRGGSINFPHLASLVTVFEEAGCSVQTRPLWGKTPFSSYWLRISSPPGIQS